MYRMLGGPQGRSGQVRKISPPPGFDPRTVQPVTSPYTDYATRPTMALKVTPRPLFTPGKDPVPTVQEAGWTPGPVWTGAENLAPTGIRSPDRAAHSQSLYRLSYPAHHCSKGYAVLQAPPHSFRVRLMQYANCLTDWPSGCSELDKLILT